MNAEMVFGDVIKPIGKNTRKPMSPRVSLGRDRDLERYGGGSGISSQTTDMGIKDEAMGMQTGEDGLLESNKPDLT